MEETDLRMFKSEDGVNNVRLRWFFRPNELFIAQGNVKGVENDNRVEVILEKALVLCSEPP